jgi:hypothetical protein
MSSKLTLQGHGRSSLLAGLLIVLVLVSCGEDPTCPPPELTGTWDLVGYADHGVSGLTTGMCTFQDNGTFAIVGTVTYPGEPVDSLSVSGTYEVTDMVVALTTPGGTGSWSLAFAGNQCFLTLVGSTPPTTMTLRRR